MDLPYGPPKADLSICLTMPQEQDDSDHMAVNASVATPEHVPGQSSKQRPTPDTSLLPTEKTRTFEISRFGIPNAGRIYAILELHPSFLLLTSIEGIEPDSWAIAYSDIGDVNGEDNMIQFMAPPYVRVKAESIQPTVSVRRARDIVMVTRSPKDSDALFDTLIESLSDAPTFWISDGYVAAQ